jgi:hypothetical protein
MDKLLLENRLFLLKAIKKTNKYFEEPSSKEELINKTQEMLKIIQCKLSKLEALSVS